MAIDVWGGRIRPQNMLLGSFNRGEWGVKGGTLWVVNPSITLVDPEWEKAIENQKQALYHKTLLTRQPPTSFCPHAAPQGVCSGKRRGGAFHRLKTPVNAGTPSLRAKRKNSYFTKQPGERKTVFTQRANRRRKGQTGHERRREEGSP